jgi:DNA repair protein RAD57
MAARSSDLVRLGALLRDLARRHNLAVVVANQVADRFSTSPMLLRGSYSHRHQQQPPMPSPAAQETPLASRSHNRHAASATGPSSSLPFQSTPATPFSFPDEDNAPPAPPALLLDHQQRWFTGWGDDPRSSLALKTPSLGLVWSTQISCRIALFKKPVYGRTRTAAPVTAGMSSEGGAGGGDDYDPDMAAPTLKSWRRWMKVVFAHHAKASGNGIDGAVEFEITLGGLKAVKRGDKKSKLETPL